MSGSDSARPARKRAFTPAGLAAPEDDWLAAEEPLQIRIAGDDLAVLMRTPGEDFPLAAGFLLGEGLVRVRGDIDGIGYCVDDEQRNTVDVGLAPHVELGPEAFERRFAANASCGICGARSIASIRKSAPPIARRTRLPLGQLEAMAGSMAARQRGFLRTGGLHAAGLFRFTGEALGLSEDVGRHNAADKVLGKSLLAGEDRADTVLLLSGRLSFEMVQKAALAGVPAVAGISAPSSLAVALARELGLILVGFLRDGRGNLYAGEDGVR